MAELVHPPETHVSQEPQTTVQAVRGVQQRREEKFSEFFVNQIRVLEAVSECHAGMPPAPRSEQLPENRCTTRKMGKRLVGGNPRRTMSRDFGIRKNQMADLV